MLATILADLRGRFGSKVLLTPEDLAEVLGVSVGQQANLRSQGRFPIPTKRMGNRVMVSIYDLAQYLARQCEGQVSPKVSPQLNRVDKKATKGRLQKDWWFTYQPMVIAIIERARFNINIIPATNKRERPF